MKYFQLKVRQKTKSTKSAFLTNFLKYSRASSYHLIFFPGSNTFFEQIAVFNFSLFPSCVPKILCNFGSTKTIYGQNILHTLPPYDQSFLLKVLKLPEICMKYAISIYIGQMGSNPQNFSHCSPLPILAKVVISQNSYYCSPLQTTLTAQFWTGVTP